MSLIFFVVPQVFVKFVTKETRFDSSVIYLVFAFILPLVWVFVPKEIIHLRNINFIQHAVGGGVAVCFISIYLIKNLKEKFPLLNNFLVQLVLVYALVSMLGVANELLEFLLDYLKVGIFSADRYDTWFDLLANSLGALGLFITYSTLRKLLGK
jgi:hypothetical protein